MLTSLSSLVDNLSEKLHSDESQDCKSVLDYMSVKNNQKQLILQCLECKNNYNKGYEKELIKTFANIYTFFKGDINKFVFYY